LIKKLELIILVSLVCIVLFSFKIPYGLAGSLDNLQNELNNETRNRAELEEYITSHNMSLSSLGPKYLDLTTLEAVVEGHIRDCQSDIHNKTVGEVSGWDESDNMKANVLAFLGDC
jgi:hypothetical protein